MVKSGEVYLELFKLCFCQYISTVPVIVHLNTFINLIYLFNNPF